MKDDLKISKVEYLRNFWLDILQMLRLGLRQMKKTEDSLKWRWPPMEDTLKY